MSVPFPCLPAPFASCRHCVMDDGAGIAVYEFGTIRTDRPAVLFLHANGFNSGCYLPILRELASEGQFFAYDARGHGASDKPIGDMPALYNFVRFTRDLKTIAENVSAELAPDQPLILMSHSFGGIAGLLAASQPTSIQKLILFDPPVTPSSDHIGFPAIKNHVGILAAGTRKRRQRWASPAAFAIALNRPEAFAHFTEDMRNAYAEAALQPCEDNSGEWHLRCPPEVEAAIYELNVDSGVFATLPKVNKPVKLIVRDRDQPPGYEQGARLLDDTAARIPDCELLRIPKAGHLMLFEKPSLCAAIARHFIYGQEPLPAMS